VAVLLKLDHFFNLIEDGAWHNLEDLSKHSKIPQRKLENLFKLLSEANIVEYEARTNQVQIKKEWQKMLKNVYREQACEKASIGIVALPPKTSINIQGIEVTNLTDEELEINMRISKKLQELAIGIIEKAKLA